MKTMWTPAGWLWRLKFLIAILFVVVMYALQILHLQYARAASTNIVVYLTSGTSWTVPSDFSVLNTIEVIGGGGGGAGGNQAVSGAAGGGGGAYSKISKLSLAP